LPHPPRTRQLHLPVEGTTEDASLHTENAAITPAADTITGVKLTGYEITKLISVSRAASAMTVAAFESFLTEIIGESIARRIENYIFTGTGSNQPGGVKTAGKGTSGAYTDGTDQVTVAASGTLSEANVVDFIVCSAAAMSVTPSGVCARPAFSRTSTRS
jgi:HK97 family phage major capsid protein